MPKARATDWTGAVYVRLYRTLPADRPDVWDDDRALAWWVRLLYAADGAWPGPAAIPRGLPDDLEAAFISAEVIDRVGASSYRFHGLNRLRGSVATLAVAGGKARALGPRGDDGRYLPTAGPSRVDEPAGHTNGKAGPTAGPSEVDSSRVGPQPSSGGGPAASASETTQPDRQTTTDPPNVGSSSSSSSSTPRGWTPPADCDDPDGHRAAHRRVPGLDVWRCPTCEAAKRSGPSLVEKVGWSPQVADDDRPF